MADFYFAHKLLNFAKDDDDHPSKMSPVSHVVLSTPPGVKNWTSTSLTFFCNKQLTTVFIRGK